MINREKLEEIALLSKLYIAEDEVQSVMDEINKMVCFADEISKTDIKADTEVPDNFGFLREDVVLPSLPAEEILRNGAECEDGYFLVRKQA